MEKEKCLGNIVNDLWLTFVLAGIEKLRLQEPLERGQRGPGETIHFINQLQDH